MPAFVRTFLPTSVAPVILLTWGCAWFALSVLVFYMGCFLPSLQAKPPPLVQRPRGPKSRPNSPRNGSIDPELSVGQARAEDDHSAPTLQRAATVPEASSSSHKRPAFKALWSFAHHPGRSASSPGDDATPTMRRAATLSDVLSSMSSSSKVSALKARNGRASPSPKSSVSSESERTLVDHLSPTRYHPDLPMIASATPSAEGRFAQESFEPAVPAASVTGSPSPTRHARLPRMKVLRSLSRRMSPKHKDTPVSRSSTPDTMDDVPESAESVDVSGDCERPRQAQRDDPASGEVFTTKFVNPFRIKPRKTKSIERSASTSPRASGPRRMLASLQLTHANDSHASSSTVPDSPRSSTSSVSTGYSTFSGSSCSSPKSVPRTRTQPYGAPFYAPMPRAGSRPPSRRAASLSLDRPATVAEESGEDAGNALGLEFRRGRQAKGQARTVPVVQRKPFFRHRTTASEGGDLAASPR